MFSHGAPATRDAGPNLLKISESPFCKRYWGPLPGSGPGTKAFKCVGKEDARANQAQKCCNCFNHRKCPLAPVATERLRRCTVKRIPSQNRKSDLTDDLVQQLGTRGAEQTAAD
jgi:hypothetical protein